MDPEEEIVLLAGPACFFPDPPTFFLRETVPMESTCGVEIKITVVEETSSGYHVVITDPSPKKKFLPLMSVVRYLTKVDDRTFYWYCDDVNALRTLLDVFARRRSKKQGVAARRFINDVPFERVAPGKRLSCVSPGLHAYKLDLKRAFLCGPEASAKLAGRTFTEHPMFGKGVAIPVSEYEMMLLQ